MLIPTTVAILSTLPSVVETVEPIQPVTVGAVCLAAAIGMACHRSYEAFDTVVSAVEITSVQFTEAIGNQTVKIVEAVGHEGTKIVPVLAGVFITLLLALLKVVVQKYWVSRKEKMKLYGESPEGNASSSRLALTLEKAKPNRPAHETTPELSRNFPRLPWLSRDLLARVVMNWKNAQELAGHEVARVPDTLCR